MRKRNGIATAGFWRRVVCGYGKLDLEEREAGE